MLKEITDSNIRSKIIEKIENTPNTSTLYNQVYNIQGPYTMAEVNKLLKQRQKYETPTTIQDLMDEIKNLKIEIRIISKKI